MMSGPLLGPDCYPRELSIEFAANGHEGPGFYWNIILRESPEVRLMGILAY